VSKKNSEFLIGVHSGSCRCWILPIENIEHIDRDSFTTTALPHFEEKWGVFVTDPIVSRALPLNHNPKNDDLLITL